MNPTIFILITFLFLAISCQSNQMQEKNHESKTTFILKEDQQILKGKITRKQFINKGNRKVKGVYDYYFEWGNHRRFIKTVKGAGGMTKDELTPFLNKKVEVVILLTEGSWDTDPTLDFPVQSRGGEYVIVYEVNYE